MPLKECLSRCCDIHQHSPLKSQSQMLKWNWWSLLPVTVHDNSKRQSHHTHLTVMPRLLARCSSSIWQMSKVMVKFFGFVFLNMDSVLTSSSTQACMIAVQNSIFAKQISPCQRDHALLLWFGEMLSFVLVLLDLICITYFHLESDSVLPWI